MTLLTLINAPSFSEAKCGEEENLDFFFPESQLQWEERIERLQELCGSCKHRTACLSFAIDNKEKDGYWGGMTPEQRSHLQKKKEAGTRRFREIQKHLSQGWTKEQISAKFNIQVASIDRSLERAKKKGLIQ